MTTQGSRPIVIREPAGERTLSLPLRVGAVVGDDIVLPGLAPGEALELCIRDGEFGVMPLGSAVALNGRALSAGIFETLRGGDVLAFGNARLIAGVPGTADASLALEVRHLAGNETIWPVDATDDRNVREGATDEKVLPASLRNDDLVGGQSADGDERPRSNLRVMAIAAVLILAVGVFGIFLSRLETVRIVVTPAEAEVSGSGFGWRSADTLLLLPGERVVRAELAGYQPIERRVRVLENTPMSLDLRLLPKPGILEIDTGGVSARVFVDGAEVGKAPGEVEVQGGSRTMTLRAERYLDHVQTLVVEGRGVRQPLAVSLQPSWGSVEVSASTAGAMVSIDGAAPVALPAKIDLPAGLHRLRISAAAAKDWQSAVLLKAGEVLRIGPVDLGAPDARLRVSSSPAGADIVVGGVFRGRTPATVNLPAGADHDVTVSLQGYRPAERRVFAAAGKELALSVSLSTIPVRLNVQGSPADAEVLVGGVLKGKTPLMVELPARRHTLELRKAGMQPERIDVDLSAAVERTVEYSLIPVGRTRDWKPPPAALRSQSGTMLRLITGGTFTMGSDRREQGRRTNEFPRKVVLARPFYIGTHEITNGEFRRFKPDHASGFVGKRTLDLDIQPASNLSWVDAVEYCNWLSTQEGLPPAYQKSDGRWTLIQPVTTGYRLPTEAEWEFVARHAGPQSRTQRYEWGDALPPPAGIGNLAGLEMATETTRVLDGWQDDYPVVAPPGKFRANGFGLFDLTGNLSEWVHDAYASFDSSTGGTDPTGPTGNVARRVVKGSNWRTANFADLRAAWREGVDNGSQDIGFRVARYAE